MRGVVGLHSPRVNKAVTLSKVQGQVRFWHLSLRLRTVHLQLQHQHVSESLVPRETREKSPSLMETCSFKPQKVLSHPQTSTELSQFQAQNNTENQLFTFFLTQPWSGHVVELETVLGSQKIDAIFLKEKRQRHQHLLNTRHCPLVSSTLLHDDIIGHSSYLMGANDQDWWVLSSVHAITTRAPCQVFN